MVFELYVCISLPQQLQELHQIELTSSDASTELKSVYPLNNAATQYCRLIAVPPQQSTVRYRSRRSPLSMGHMVIGCPYLLLLRYKDPKLIGMTRRTRKLRENTTSSPPETSKRRIQHEHVRSNRPWKRKRKFQKLPQLTTALGSPSPVSSCW